MFHYYILYFHSCLSCSSFSDLYSTACWSIAVWWSHDPCDLPNFVDTILYFTSPYMQAVEWWSWPTPPLPPPPSLPPAPLTPSLPWSNHLLLVLMWWRVGEGGIYGPTLELCFIARTLCTPIWYCWRTISIYTVLFLEFFIVFGYFLPQLVPWANYSRASRGDDEAIFQGWQFPSQGERTLSGRLCHLSLVIKPFFFHFNLWIHVYSSYYHLITPLFSFSFKLAMMFQKLSTPPYGGIDN